MPDKDRGREPAISISISEGTPEGLEAVLAEAAKSGRPRPVRAPGATAHGAIVNGQPRTVPPWPAWTTR